MLRHAQRAAARRLPLPSVRGRPLAATAAATAAPSPDWAPVLALAAAASDRPPRLYAPGVLTPALAPPAVITLDEGEARHARALRLGPGAAVELCDGRGLLASGVLAGGEATGRRGGGGAAATVTLTSPPSLAPRPSPRWTLAVAGVTGGLKGGRGDWAVEKGAELGAAAVVPLLTARGGGGRDRGGGGDGGRTERWRRLAAAASKQSLRPHGLEVRDAVALTDLLPAVAAAPLALVAVAGGAPVLDVLEARRAALAGAEGECFLLVGPEGDWAPDELAALAAAGAVPVGLGSARLRVETAALALLAAVALQAP